MTPEQQRIAIAQACGWTGFNPDNIPDCLQYTARAPSGKWGLIPDYLNDLNAMHEAEEWLLINDTHAFACYLSDFFEVHGCGAIHLEAYQRAEAFLRTIGKWVES